jgi:hypothetical protein
MITEMGSNNVHECKKALRLVVRLTDAESVRFYSVRSVVVCKGLKSIKLVSIFRTHSTLGQIDGCSESNQGKCKISSQMARSQGLHRRHVADVLTAISRCKPFENGL